MGFSERLAARYAAKEAVQELAARADTAKKDGIGAMNLVAMERLHPFEAAVEKALREMRSAPEYAVIFGHAEPTVNVSAMGTKIKGSGFQDERRIVYESSGKGRHWLRIVVSVDSTEMPVHIVVRAAKTLSELGAGRPLAQAFGHLPEQGAIDTLKNALADYVVDRVDNSAPLDL